ncbi:Six-hairpin glycosidase-like protein [Epithele typhae]|uniref:Six-hairpin glycosidase-like protein n=1 Tax=Epithele typhae TaxID=378194 RepID=UPI0020087055|nr:Six-hairpin glycosidase-like protein [Epithele typhae]KAH9921973.1 Six-hairpin glycosidase-like protein [Epithele typhae]
MPHWDDNSLQNYTGWFHSNDEKLNRVWYAGAYTNQMVTIDPTRGDTLIYLGEITSNSTVTEPLDWWLNTTITKGASALTDGAKRDRLVWSGDMAIAVPGIAVTTSDYISISNALDSLYRARHHIVHLPPLRAHRYHWTGDRAYLDDKWNAFKAGLEWAAVQIDGSGLANVTASADWLRFGMGGHNIEANAILFYTLNLGVTLAMLQGETDVASRWESLAAGIQTSAVPLLWQEDVGLFRDNETTTLAPQDGNAWAVKSGLVTDPAQIAKISSSLEERWTPYGAPAPEAADAISPFITGFELDVHFAANRTATALELVRYMWADFMLDDPRMTNSTFIEGYSTTGELHYAPYVNDPRISHAHGWATGPTSSLTMYVAGIQILSDAGATWAIVPQAGDLTFADAGFQTARGLFSSKWSVENNTFTLSIRMLARLILVAAFAAGVAAVPYQEYILAPSSRTVRPVSIFQTDGPSTTPEALLDGNIGSGGNLTLNAFNASVTYDFGKNIAGWVSVNVTSSSGSVGFTYTESSLWVSSWACDSIFDQGPDEPLIFNVTAPGIFSAPNEKERGGFRYLTVVNFGQGNLTIDDLWVDFSAMPHWDDLQNYTGWFHSDDEKLNRVWYAGAYTDQLVTIASTRGDAITAGASGGVLNANGTVTWFFNTTIANGTSVLTDGAKRDRLVWAGDMSIAIPSIAVSTYDLPSVLNALDSLLSLQGTDGTFPYAGIPFGPTQAISFTYHLHALINLSNYYQWSGDRAFLDRIWDAWKLGMSWATAQIDDSGLADVSSSEDWLRFYMGGHNIEANAILFHTLNLGAALAAVEDDPDTAASYTSLATGIQSAAQSLLWQPSVGLFKDNDTSTTLAPQDGNAWAVYSGLVTSPSQASTISAALQARWTAWGAPAPEAADAVSPFASGFELDAHFLANRTAAALALVRSMWADVMLDDPRMTNSTFIEGYSATGEIHYPPYATDSRISFAHGWASGPTGSLTILTAAGATWSIAPQPDDLSTVDAALATTLGQFSVLYFSTTTSLVIQINTPVGTTGSVGLPFPGNATSATLTRSDAGGAPPATVDADAFGRHWLRDVAGGEYEFTLSVP